VQRAEVALVGWRSGASGDVVEADSCLYDVTTAGGHATRMGGTYRAIRMMMVDSWGAGERLGRLWRG